MCILLHLQKRINMISKLKNIFDTSIKNTNGNVGELSWDARHQLHDYDCYYPIVDMIHENCFNINEVIMDIK